MEERRNPSPPLDGEAESNLISDSIGQTCFSKTFVLETLLDVVKESEKESEDEKEELEKDLEQTLSQLWDMSVNEGFLQEVASFLVEADVVDIFSIAVRNTNKPRLTEILVGILANLLCIESCFNLLKNEPKIIEIALKLISCRDTPTLIEVTRLFSVILGKNAWSADWEMAFAATKSWEDLAFIISSTTSEKLLQHSAQVVDSLLDAKTSASTADNFLGAAGIWRCLLEGIDQALADDNYVSLASLVHSLLSLTLLQGGKDIIAREEEALLETILKCVKKLQTKEELKSSHVSSLASIFSLIRRFWNFWSGSIDQEEVQCVLVDLIKRLKGVERTSALTYKEAALNELKHLVSRSEERTPFIAALQKIL